MALVWHTKYGVYRRKEKVDVRDDPMLGSSDVFLSSWPQNFSWLMRKGLIGCLIATGLHWLGLSFA